MKFSTLFFTMAVATYTPALGMLRGRELATLEKIEDLMHTEQADISHLFAEIEALKLDFQGRRNLGKLDDKKEATEAEIKKLEAEIEAREKKVKGMKEACKPKDKATNQADKVWKKTEESCKKFQKGKTPFDEAIERSQKKFEKQKDEIEEAIDEIEEQIKECDKAIDEAQKEGNKEEKKEQENLKKSLVKDRDDAKKDKKKARQIADKAKKAAKDGWTKAFNACKKDRDANKKEFDRLRNDGKKAQQDLKKELRELEKLRRTAKKHQKILKNVNKKIKTKKTKKKNKKKKTKKEVVKELVAGQCVADHACASIRGDPHIETFDGLRYDCQGEGEFVLAKTINSENTFEVQGRFKAIKKDPQVAITTGMSITTGVVGEPDVDVYTEPLSDGDCGLFYYVDGVATTWETPVAGISFEDGETDYVFYTGSGIMLSLYAKNGMFGCVINAKLCLPPSMVAAEDIVGLFGTPDGIRTNEWTTPSGAERSTAIVGKPQGYAYCTKDWCVRSAEQSIFGYVEGTQWSDYFNCDADYDKNTADIVLDPPAECEECCKDITDAALFDNCILECSSAEEGDRMEQCVIDIEDSVQLSDAEKKCSDPVIPDDGSTDRSGGDPTCDADTRTCPDGTVLTRVPPFCQFKQCPEDQDITDKTTERAFTRGDPHFKTFGGELYDFHGECDLVLMHNPDFKEGLGMDVHIRTKITDWWSSVESAAVQIGKETVEIQASEDSKWLWINGKVNDDDLEDGKWYRSEVAGFLVRYRQSDGKLGVTREAKIYVDGSKEAVELKSFKSFVRVDIAWKESQNYNGATGLLGSRDNDGARVGRDGVVIEDVIAFGQEWQVLASEPRLFHSYEGAVLPPNKCKMPDDSVAKQALRKRRLAEGMSREEAEAACSHLEDAAEKEACVYDVLATQDLGLASAW